MIYINRILTLPAVFLAILVFIIAFKRDYSVDHCLILMIDFVAAAQPQVLVAAIFLSLALIANS